MRTARLTSFGLITLLAAIALVQRAHAQFTFFTDRSAWEAAVGTFDTEDFNEVPLQTLMTEGLGFPYSEHQVGKISIGVKGDQLGKDVNPTIRDTNDHLSPNGTRHLGGVLREIEVIMRAAIVFHQPVTAFGADWASASNRSGVRLNIDERSIQLADHLVDTGDGFFGVVAAEPFQDVFMSSHPYEDYGLDNVSFPVSVLAGDYDASGNVEQADLDLVLLHWGNSTPPAPSTWTNDLPEGLIDQAELDKVLLNWGNSADVATHWVPEPGSLCLLVLAIACGQIRNRRRFIA